MKSFFFSDGTPIVCGGASPIKIGDVWETTEDDGGVCFSYQAEIHENNILDTL